MPAQVVGWDLGIKRSALVQVTDDELISLMKWGKGPKTRDLPGILKFFQAVVQSQASILSKSYVAIDWSPTEAYYRGNREAIVVKAMVSGYVFRSILDLGGYPVFVSPKVVRDLVRLKSNVSKDIVQRAFQNTILPHFGFDDDHLQGMNEHEVDSVLLALTLKWAISLKESKPPAYLG